MADCPDRQPLPSSDTPEDGMRWLCPWCGALLLPSCDRCPCGYQRDGSEQMIDTTQAPYSHGMLKKLLGRDGQAALDDSSPHDT